MEETPVKLTAEEKTHLHPVLLEIIFNLKPAIYFAGDPVVSPLRVSSVAETKT